MLITSQSNTPCKSGFTPTDFSTSVESEAPIKNMVMMSPLRANPEMAFPTSGTLLSR